MKDFSAFLFFSRFCWCGPFLKSFLKLLQYCFCSMFQRFGHKACGILAPPPGIKPHTPCTGRKSLNHWTTRKFLSISMWRGISFLSPHLPTGATTMLHLISPLCTHTHFHHTHFRNSLFTYFSIQPYLFPNIYTLTNLCICVTITTYLVLTMSKQHAKNFIYTYSFLPHKTPTYYHSNNFTHFTHEKVEPYRLGNLLKL